MIIKINKKLIQLIKEKQYLFELPTPNLGDIYHITEINVFPNVNYGKPVIELQKDNDTYYLKHIPLDIFSKEELVEWNI